jgi:hypothetical protein
METVDPSIRIVAAGAPPGPATWNHNLLGLLTINVLAMSIYTGEPEERVVGTRIYDQDYFYRKVVAEPQDFAQHLDQIVRDMGDRFPRDHPLIAITEFNSWWLSEKVDPDYRLCNGLYFAGVFNALLRRANQIVMAEASTTLNVQGIVSINPVGVKLTPPYFTYLLYRNHIGSQVLSTTTQTPMTDFNPQLPALDAIATLGEDGNTIYLAVVNRSEAEDMPTVLDLKSWASKAGIPPRVLELNGKAKVAANTYGSADNVNIREKTLNLERMPLSYNFPAHSVTVIELSGHHRAP